jgi:chloramphenicol 3-O phosphotransferase
MSKIIILNGTSSVGKSSIAHEIHMNSSIPFIHFCMDGFFGMLHPRFNGLGLDHLQKRYGDYKLGFYTSDAWNGYNIECGEIGQKIDNALPYCIRECAKQGLNIVCPAIITTTKLMNSYKDILRDFDTTFIYIDCDIDIIAKREKERCDRIVVTSINLLNKFETQDLHDFTFDSTNHSSKQIANEILNFVKLTQL